jgi:hypothetical protein
VSDHQHDESAEPTTPTATAGKSTKPASPAVEKLSGLMANDATGTKSAPKPKAAPDLEQEALRAAEAAIAAGERSVAAAEAELRATAQKRAPSRGREFALRLLLAGNVLAMVVVALLPTPKGRTEPAPPPPAPAPQAAQPQAPVTPRLSDPWNKALVAAERRDFATAVATLESWLAESPRMAPSQQLSVMMALSHYAARNGDIGRSQDWQRRADAIERSHSLPEDLVAMATAAAASGDQESLRRVWARFLLQQRQIPSWLYKHVAEAYLQLGDSYRKDADASAEKARLAEAAAMAERLRQEAVRAAEEKR